MKLGCLALLTILKEHLYFQKNDLLPAALILATIILPVWHSLGMDRVYSISAASVFNVQAVDDRSQGGKSVVALTKHASGEVSFDCQINNTYQWPYCEVMYYINKGQQPVDLSRFNSIRLSVQSEGPGPQFIKVYLRNSSPRYTKIENELSLKINQIQFDPNNFGYQLDVPLDNFVVAPWWIDEMGLSPLEADSEVDSIVEIDIATGDYRKPGLHKLHIKILEFHGKWISYTELASGLLALWLCYSFFTLFNKYRKTQQQVEQERLTKQILQDINNTLSLEKIELEDQAVKDPLTGAFNRAGLKQQFLQLMSMYCRHGEVFSLIFLDLDHFKSINDTYGHDVGDTVLKQLATLLEMSTRDEDTLGRWGGEEFILLCPKTNLKSAEKLAEKLRFACESADWPSNIPVTGSFGVAQISKNEDVHHLIERADQALYQAKSEGRNIVVTSKS